MDNENLLSGRQVLITGVGFQPVRYVFQDVVTSRPTHTAICHGGQEYKANIGAAIARKCALAGARVWLVARTLENLQIVADWIVESGARRDLVQCLATDLADKNALEKMGEGLPDDLPLYWVQSVGLGAGTVKLADNNPYLPLEDLSEDLMEAEMGVLRNTFRLAQLLLPRFRRQDETRVCIISSMSAVRSFPSGCIHSAAKGALKMFTNALRLGQAQDRIFVTDVRPGAVDTGMYDSPVVQRAVAEIAKGYGYDWSPEAGGLRLMPPESVAKMVLATLTCEAHITSVSLVARGQFSHEGS